MLHHEGQIANPVLQSVCGKGSAGQAGVVRASGMQTFHQGTRLKDMVSMSGPWRPLKNVMSFLNASLFIPTLAS